MPQPKIHRYNRPQRLKHAKEWIKTYTGKRIHHGYAKHYAIDKLCAIKELEILGFIFPPELKESIIRSQEDRKKQREKLKRKNEINLIESDYYFAFIAGYTPNGTPYGITLEETKAQENNKPYEIPTEILKFDDYFDEVIENKNYNQYKIDTEEDLPF